MVGDSGLKVLKIGTYPASQKLLAHGHFLEFILEITKFLLAQQPEALVNTSGQVLFSRPATSVRNFRTLTVNLFHTK